jgi:BirA family biotin operon repressor/biotin-[acetyl-CoA-carboxylase] ligase
MTGVGPGAEAAPILMLEWTDSTNAEARRRAEAGEIGPLWIAARHQTAGRGRRGRTWTTGEGDLAATLLTTTDRPPAEAAQMSFVAALAVADLVQTYIHEERVRLKWPNDVLVDGAKIAGVLIESGSRADRRLWLAVGIGVNLTGAPTDLDRPATAVARHAAAPDPRTALALLADRFAVWQRIWQDFGFAPIADGWRQRAYGLGELCTARLGAETLEGVAEDLDGDGALRLRLADGNLRKIAAGDVFFGGA